MNASRGLVWVFTRTFAISNLATDSDLLKAATDKRMLDGRAKKLAYPKLLLNAFDAQSCDSLARLLQEFGQPDPSVS